MKLKPKITIDSHFNNIHDKRVERRKLHKLIDIITITICAVIGGADTWEDIAMFGKAKQKWFKEILELPNGIPFGFAVPYGGKPSCRADSPSHDTFARVIAQIDPEQFQKSFIGWIQSISKLANQEIIAIDGKTLRSSYDTNKEKVAIHMVSPVLHSGFPSVGNWRTRRVSAWATANHLVLGQVKVDEKSNEITAIPELLRILYLKGCIVTIDAIGCQKDIVKQIVDQGGDYVISLKLNQKSLYKRVDELFKEVIKNQFEGFEYSEIRMDEKGHGREEIRHCVMLSNIQEFIDPEHKWLNLYSVGMMYSWRTENGKTTFENRYFISSLSNNSELLAQSIRNHWTIENGLHWVLDVQFNEDNSRIRNGNAPQNLATVRHIALNFLNQEKTVKAGVKRKRNRAGWDTEYLEKVLTGIFIS